MRVWMYGFTDIGMRPSSFLRGTGWVLAALLYAMISGIALGTLLSLLVMLLGELFQTSPSGIAVGLALWSVQCFGVAFLMLLNSARLPRLQWASWWVLWVDAALRMLSGVALMSGAPRGWAYGATAFIGYDFKAASSPLGLATIVGAISTVLALSVFALRRDHDASPSNKGIEQTAQASVLK